MLPHYYGFRWSCSLLQGAACRYDSATRIPYAISLLSITEDDDDDMLTVMLARVSVQ